jgi:hypothetical protein
MIITEFSSLKPGRLRCACRRTAAAARAEAAEQAIAGRAGRRVPRHRSGDSDPALKLPSPGPVPGASDRDCRSSAEGSPAAGPASLGAGGSPRDTDSTRESQGLGPRPGPAKGLGGAASTLPVTRDWCRGSSRNLREGRGRPRPGPSARLRI